jgi:hypothetical protein
MAQYPLVQHVLSRLSMSKHNIVYFVAVSGFLLITTGCSKTDDSKRNYQAVLDDFYKAHPLCLWSEPKKFPVEARTSDETKTQSYDALTDAGLLIRSTAEKKVFIIGSKQVNNYDISPEKGRQSWTADPSQPGYGNFCYGHGVVTSVDNASLSTNSAGLRTVQVNYHYKIEDVPAWADSQEIKTAFPSVGSASVGSQASVATLVMNGTTWQVNHP